jgi:hypothetical protein
MTKQLEDFVDVKVAIKNSVTSTTLVATAVDTTGFGRARFVFNLGGVAEIGAVSANAVKIWKGDTQGGTYTSIASAELAAITSGAISAAGCVAVIDVPTDPSNPWLKVSGALTSSNLYHSAVCELYNGVSNPPTSSAQQIVTV